MIKVGEMIKVEQLFPTILIALDLGASLIYALSFNFRLAIYWFAAAVLTACITF